MMRLTPTPLSLNLRVKDSSRVHPFLTRHGHIPSCLIGPCDPGNPSLAQPFLAGGRIPRIAWITKQHGMNELRRTLRLEENLP